MTFILKKPEPDAIPDLLTLGLYPLHPNNTQPFVYGGDPKQPRYREVTISKVMSKGLDRSHDYWQVMHEGKIQRVKTLDLHTIALALRELGWAGVVPYFRQQKIDNLLESQ